MSHPVRSGIIVGVLLAFFQATVSVLLLKLYWKKSAFFKVWAASTLARFAAFAAVAFVVYRFTFLNLAATLLSLAVATMLFLIIEVQAFLAPKK